MRSVEIILAVVLGTGIGTWVAALSVSPPHQKEVEALKNELEITRAIVDAGCIRLTAPDFLTTNGE